MLSVECYPKIESSFQETGKILDVEITGMGTFLAILKKMEDFTEKDRVCYFQTTEKLSHGLAMG